MRASCTGPAPAWPKLYTSGSAGPPPVAMDAGATPIWVRDVPSARTSGRAARGATAPDLPQPMPVFRVSPLGHDGFHRGRHAQVQRGGEGDGGYDRAPRGPPAVPHACVGPHLRRKGRGLREAEAEERHGALRRASPGKAAAKAGPSRFVNAAAAAR